MSKIKEPHYFDKNIERRRQIEWYNKLFNWRSPGIKGECSPSYGVFHKKCAPRIHKYNPKIKLILLVRNSVDRLISQYKYELITSSLYNQPGFRRNVTNKTPLIHFFIKNIKECKDRGIFSKQIEGYLKFFPELYILSFLDLIQNPLMLMDKIFKFLSLESYEIKVPTKTHPDIYYKISSDKLNKLKKEVNDHLERTTSDKHITTIKRFYHSEIMLLRDKYKLRLT